MLWAVMSGPALMSAPESSPPPPLLWLQACDQHELEVDDSPQKTPQLATPLSLFKRLRPGTLELSHSVLAMVSVDWLCVAGARSHSIEKADCYPAKATVR